MPTCNEKQPISCSTCCRLALLEDNGLQAPLSVTSQLWLSLPFTTPGMQRVSRSNYDCNVCSWLSIMRADKRPTAGRIAPPEVCWNAVVQLSFTFGVKWSGRGTYTVRRMEKQHLGISWAIGQVGGHWPCPERVVQAQVSGSSPRHFGSFRMPT